MGEESLPNPYSGDHVWPGDLHCEMIDMALVSFLIYEFAFIVDAAKKNGSGFVGFEFDEDNTLTRTSITNAALKKSWTPGEIIKLIEDNQAVLAKYDRASFTGSTLEKMKGRIGMLQARADASGLDRPLVVEEFDDKFQSTEAVYGITRDSINKRITVVFRGTENKLAFKSNWSSNAMIAMKKVDAPEALKGKIQNDYVKFHTGFHDYLFNETKDRGDTEGSTKYDQVMTDVKSLLAKYPDHKIYLTGHSLGAALSSVAAFYFACDPDLPKPVTCINFASPRSSGWNAFLAYQYLEQTKQLRMIRSVNENDSVTTLPSIGYHHVGFQVTAYEDGWFFNAGPPDIVYRNLNDDVFTRTRKSWGNNFLTNLNVGYDHGGYIQRIEAAKEYLKKDSLNALYMDETIVGYKLKDPESLA